MYVTKATPEDMQQMVDKMNELWPSIEVTYERINPTGKTWNIWANLRGKPGDMSRYDQPGWRWNPAKTRRMPFACWHVWGDLLDSLPDHVYYRSKNGNSSQLMPCGTQHEHNWDDWAVSTPYAVQIGYDEFMYMSETCGMCYE